MAADKRKAKKELKRRLKSLVKRFGHIEALSLMSNLIQDADDRVLAQEDAREISVAPTKPLRRIAVIPDAEE